MSFIKNYLDFTSSQETTERVHRWVGISTVAGAMERKVWLHRGTYTLYPNLYTCIVGPSGIVRKSTSTAIGVDLLRDLPTVDILSERVTAATLIEQLAVSKKTFSHKGHEIKQSPLFAYASELNVFLDDVFGSIIELLTTFYDCVPHDSTKSWKYTTIGRGETEIFGPCLNILGACTPAWLTKSIPPSEMEGGFASRMIFVVEDKAKRAIAWPDMEVRAEDFNSMRRFLVSDLKRIHELNGPMRITPELRKLGQLWYESHQQAAHSNTDMRFAGYYGRKFDTVLKVAMAISVSESSELVLEVRHFEEALGILSDVESRMMDLFGARGENPDALLLTKVWNYLRKHKRAPMNRIMAAFYTEANYDKLSVMLNTLDMMHRLHRVNDEMGRDVYFEAIDPDKPLN